MNVYIDEMFLVNSFVDFLLIISAAKISGENVSAKRAAAASCFGGFYGLILIFPNLKIYTAMFFRFVFSLVMLFTAFGKRKNFLKILLGFYISLFAFAGMTVVFANMGLKAVMYKGNIYFDFPLGGFIMLAGILTVIINRICGYFKSLLSNVGTKCDIFIKYKEKSISADGIFDTGNFLCEPISGKAVAVADIGTVRELFGSDFAAAVMKNDYSAALALEPSFLIPYGTVGNPKGFLITIKPDIFKINDKKVRVLIGISASSGKSIIINPSVTETGVVTK